MTLEYLFLSIICIWQVYKDKRFEILNNAKKIKLLGDSNKEKYGF